MEIRKEDSSSIAPLVYEIVKHSFTREFDKLPQNIEEVIGVIGDNDVYVAYQENGPVGYFILQNIDDGNLELNSIAVHQDHQGKGIGKLLMTKVLELAENKNMQLYTHPKNTTALIMYLKHGFVVDSWADNYLGDGEPRLKLVREAK